jgi:hypothetical protein
LLGSCAAGWAGEIYFLGHLFAIVAMPFTPLHAALVLPARYLPGNWKRKVSITGLLTGSVAPDFEKFIQMRGGNTYSHTLPGVFGFDLPMSLLLAVVFHLAVKNTLIDYLPTALYTRFSAYKNQPWLGHLQQKYGAVMLSMLIGIFSHLALDSMTHANGALVRRLAVLSNYYDVFFLNIRGYQLVEFCYYVLSALAIGWAVVALPRQFPVRPARQQQVLFWLGFMGLTLLVIWLRLAISPGVRHIWDLASLATAAALISLLLSCLAWPRNT